MPRKTSYQRPAWSVMRTMMPLPRAWTGAWVAARREHPHPA
ncbi:hypothetical protein [Mycolicibacterium wolinskyi]|nr:hypothetical protein [Mycolicibacterium wolinskyi]